MNVDLENDIDRLYVAPREEFVRERDALVRTLRAAGDRDAAAEVGALRKPTLVAWTVNQLAHKERRDVDLLLDAGKRIIDAQEASIAKGGRADLDAAQASLRRAVSGLTEQASAILGPDASKTTLTRVAETLRTAATAPAGRELLARGRLSEELSGTGWEIVAGFAPSPRAPSKRAAQAGRRSRPTPTAERAAEIQAQARRLRELKQSLAAAEKRQRTASRQERAAAERLEELRAARSDADAEVESLGGRDREGREGARRAAPQRGLSRRRDAQREIVRGSPSRREARAAPTSDPASTAARRCRTAARRARSCRSPSRPPRAPALRPRR